MTGASTIASQFMFAALRAQPGDAIRWVISSTGQRANDFAAKHDIPHFGTDLKAALADPGVDAVYISSINDKHFAQTMAAIAAGKHVLCEKPLAMTVANAVSMVAAANHHLRCSGSHQTIRDLIRSGRIGRVLSVRIRYAVHLPETLQSWRIKSAASGGGDVADFTVHDANVARFPLVEDPQTVVAQVANSGLGQGAEVEVMSVWTMPLGAMASSHDNFTHPYAGSGLEVHGTTGSIFARGIMTQKPVGQIAPLVRRICRCPKSGK